MKSFFLSVFRHSLSGLAALAAFSSGGAAAEPAALSLPALVASTVIANPELAFYEAELAAAKARTRIASAPATPELNVEFGRKRVRDSRGMLAGEGTVWAVSLTQAFEWPGRLALRKAIANRDVELAELGVVRFRQALAARARTLAYGLHVAHTKASAIREVADRFTALKATFLARDPAGVTPLLETRVIESAELSLQRRATESELALQGALIELNLLRGAPPESTLRISPPGLAFQDAPDTGALLAAARENNFEFRIRRVELEQQGLQVRLAHHERRPAFRVSPFLAQESAGDRERVAGIGVSVPLPISGRTQGTLDAAEARRRQVEASLFVAQRNLERDVLTTAQTFTTKLAESRRWARDTATTFRESAELADRHYRLGAVPVATYIELQKSYLDAVEACLDTQQEVLDAGLRLQALTGLEFHAVEITP